MSIAHGIETKLSLEEHTALYSKITAIVFEHAPRMKAPFAAMIAYALIRLIEARDALAAPSPTGESLNAVAIQQWHAHTTSTANQQKPRNVREIAMCAEIEALRAALATPRQTEDGGLSAAERLNQLDRMLAECRLTDDHKARQFLGAIIHDLAASTFAPKEPAAQGGVPAGWQLVPKEPTQDMIENTAAFDLEGEDDANNAYRIIYCAMLAAAPAPTGTSK